MFGASLKEIAGAYASLCRDVPGKRSTLITNSLDRFFSNQKRKSDESYDDDVSGDLRVDGFEAPGQYVAGPNEGRCDHIGTSEVLFRCGVSRRFSPPTNHGERI